MGCYLLTGATGMLGQRLLADALRSGWRIAVVVRRRNRLSVATRVDAILQQWERREGRYLPRPVVLAGNLHQADLGLSSQDRRWIAQHCDAVIHSAASTTFYGEPAHGEPFRSNVDGTRHLLDFCQTVGIRKFHHISTAYVCGLSDGRVRENDSPPRPTFGNDYERSKFEAERLVREAAFLDAPTILRPSIIVGDSVSGHISAFHGVYVPLQLGYLSLWAAFGDQPPQLDTAVVSEIVEREFIRKLGLQGEHRKNLVPIDWVSAAILHLVGRAEHHGKTYHLTHPEPVTVRALQETMVASALAAFHSSGTRPLANSLLQADSNEVRRHLDVYRAYFRDDPEFDATNTQQAAAELSCAATRPIRARQAVVLRHPSQFWLAPARAREARTDHTAPSAASRRDAAHQRGGARLSVPGSRGQWTGRRRVAGVVRRRSTGGCRAVRHRGRVRRARTETC